MIVQTEQNLTLSAVAALQKYADAGLPIIFLGGEPGYYRSSNGRDQEAIETTITTLGNSQNVHKVAAGEVVSALRALGLVPQITVQTNGTWWTTWREDDRSGVDYAFVFGDTNATTGQIEVQTTKTPYIFDVWTGSQTPLLQYSTDANSTTIPLSLAGNQTMVIAFVDDALFV